MSDTTDAATCIHCGVGLTVDLGEGLFVHVTGLQRCQAQDVPYGHMGHPALPCPPGDITPCLGFYREGGNCIHVYQGGHA